MKRKITSILKAATRPAAAMMMVALLFSSCTKTELQDLQLQSSDMSKSASLPSVNDDKSNSTTDINPIPSIPADAIISITHGTCMGNCPVYRVVLSKNGDVTYTGYRNVGVKGTVRYHVSPETAYGLGNMMEHEGFFSFPDEYPVVPDAQRFETTLMWNGKIKTIVDYGVNVPEELVKMRNKVEIVLDVQRFLHGYANISAVNATQ